MALIPTLCGDNTIYVPPTSEDCALTTKNITANGSYYAAEDGYDGYSEVSVDVPNSYSASDEGKVVSNGALVAQGSRTITQNGTYDTTLINSLTANITGGGGDEYLSLDLTKFSGVSFNEVTYDSNGANFNSTSSYFRLGQPKNNEQTIEVDVTKLQLTSGTHRRFIMSNETDGFIYRSTGVWGFYTGNWDDSSITDGSFFDNSTVGIYIDVNMKWHIYKDGVLVFEPRRALTVNYAFWIGSSDNSINNAIIPAVRLYFGNKYA